MFLLCIALVVPFMASARHIQMLRMVLTKAAHHATNDTLDNGISKAQNFCLERTGKWAVKTGTTLKAEGFSHTAFISALKLSFYSIASVLTNHFSRNKEKHFNTFVQTIGRQFSQRSKRELRKHLLVDLPQKQNYFLFQPLTSLPFLPIL